METGSSQEIRLWVTDKNVLKNLSAQYQNDKKIDENQTIKFNNNYIFDI